MTTRLSAPFKAWWHSVRPGPGELQREAVAGLPGAIGSVPDGMASAVLAGVLRLGRFTRFVSHSVMIGFLTGVAANIAFGQLPDLTGVDAEGSSSLTKGLDVILHPGNIDIPSLVAGLGCIIIILGKTKLAPYASIIGLAIPTVLVLGVDSVAKVATSVRSPVGSRCRQSPTSA